MAQTLNLEGMIDSTPIMQEFADVETGNKPEYTIDSKIPEGPIAEKWTNYKAHQHLVNPANKRNLDIHCFSLCQLLTSFLSGYLGIVVKLT